MSDGDGVDARELTAHLAPTFQAILDDTYGHSAAIRWVEELLANLSAQLLEAIDAAGFDLVGRVGPRR